MELGRFYFQLKQIDLGETDEDGDPITSAVVVKSDAKLGEREEEVYLWIKENNDKYFNQKRDTIDIDKGQLSRLLKSLMKKEKVWMDKNKYFPDPTEKAINTINKPYI